MRRWLGVAVLNLLLLIVTAESLSSHSADASELSYGNSGYWYIFAWYKPTGAFGYCGMKTGSTTGPETLTLTASERGYMLFLDDTDWQLPVGDQYGVDVFISRLSWHGNATAYFSSGVALVFPWESGFGKAFASGTNLLMRFSNGKYWTLKLAGSQAALSRLAGCLTANKIDRNPFASARPYGTNPFR